jgi:peptide/nickel transport system permease protein
MRRAIAALRGDRAGAVGVAIVLCLLIFALIGPWLTSYAPDAIALPDRLEAPSWSHWMGTDELGRDLFARIAYGARPSLLAAISVVAVTIAVGTVIGGLAGIVGGWAEAMVMRAVDVMLAVPPLVLAMALAAALGPSLINALIALLVVRLPFFVRLARGQTIGLMTRGYVEAALLAGAGKMYLLRHHVAPNLAGIMLIQGLSDVAGVILAAAALGFIGLGAQPPSPEWGALVAAGRSFALDAWWYGVFPGAAILIAAVGFNLLGDWARDLLDPRTGDIA